MNKKMAILLATLSAIFWGANFNVGKILIGYFAPLNLAMIRFLNGTDHSKIKQNCHHFELIPFEKRTLKLSVFECSELEPHCICFQ